MTRTCKCFLSLRRKCENKGHTLQYRRKEKINIWFISRPVSQRKQYKHSFRTVINFRTLFTPFEHSNIFLKKIKTKSKHFFEVVRSFIIVFSTTGKTLHIQNRLKTEKTFIYTMLQAGKTLLAFLKKSLAIRCFFPMVLCPTALLLEILEIASIWRPKGAFSSSIVSWRCDLNI